MRKINIDKATIRRKKAEDADNDGQQPKNIAITQGTVDRIVDLALNPSREKIREFTSVDRVQAKLLPQLDLVNTIWDYAIEIAEYRQDSEHYKKVHRRKQPSLPDLISDFIYRTAQWQKSVQGMNLKSGIDLALADIEGRAGATEGDIFEQFDNR